jgi:hypothetical protein
MGSFAARMPDVISDHFHMGFLLLHLAVTLSHPIRVLESGRTAQSLTSENFTF